MNKKDAAAFLGVSTRAVERYVSKGKLNPKYVPGRTGLAPDFDEAELKKIKQEMEAPPSPVKRIPTPGDKPDKPAKRDTALALSGLSPQQMLESMTAALALKFNMATASVPIMEKLSLSLDEAIEFSGCSKSAIQEAVQSGLIKSDHKGKHGALRLSKDDVVKFAKKF